MILLKKGIEIFLEIDMSRLQLSNCRSFWLKPRLQEILTMKIRPMLLSSHISSLPPRCVVPGFKNEFGNIRRFATKHVIVDGAVISIDDGNWQTEGASAHSLGQKSIVIMCLLKSKQRPTEMLLLSKHRADLRSISIEPPSCHLLGNESFRDAAFREVKAQTGYSITNFAPGSDTVYSENFQGNKCPTKLVVAEIDLTTQDNRNAKLVHELGEKITVVRLPLGKEGIQARAARARCDIPVCFSVCHLLVFPSVCLSVHPSVCIHPRRRGRRRVGGGAGRLGQLYIQTRIYIHILIYVYVYIY